MVRIRVLPHGMEWTAEGSNRLLDLLDDRGGGGLPVSCRSANCGTCRVRVLRGADLLEPAAPGERETLRLTGALGEERLGCQIRLRDQAEGELDLLLSSSAATTGS